MASGQLPVSNWDLTGHWKLATGNSFEIMLTYLQSLPPRTLFYLGSAAAIAVLLVIALVRNRLRAAQSRSRAASRLAAVEAPAASLSTPHASPAIREAAAAARAAVGRTFSGLQTPPDRLPVVEAAETPVANDSDRAFGWLTPVFASFLPESPERAKETKRELVNAGYYQPHAYENLQAARYLTMFGGLVLAGILLILAPARLEPYAVATLIALPLLGWALPRLAVKGRGADRRTEIERAMPDMLDMLNMCVSQGMTVPAALKRVSHELPNVHPSLHKELQIIGDQAKIATLDVALDNFRRRMDVPEVHSFCNLMLQTERMGTSVSHALQEYSDNMRASLQQRADEKGNRAAFKLLFPTVLCLMPAIYMVLLGPAMVSLQRYTEARNNDTMTQQARELLSGNRAE